MLLNKEGHVRGAQAPKEPCSVLAVRASKKVRLSLFDLHEPFLY